MNLTRCEKGHFFDLDNYPECPYCSKDAAARVNSFREPDRSQFVKCGNQTGLWAEDYDHCHRCKYAYERGDRWCRRCGIKREHILCSWFQTFEEISVNYAYGLPDCVFRCRACGFTWTVMNLSMYTENIAYCPQCGSDQLVKNLRK